ncbi:hypothetical protein [Alteromonas sp. a30]|uniref:hypothetical protein n=1 Tax=Alteromonas sp. a30 TaxID=2730917 RepID=UPI00227F596A|nr:hypothetical protein [Alteromonas sp. a30]MCY7297426.1 hypothetical protein [Alteromonas sp. a30]
MTGVIYISWGIEGEAGPLWFMLTPLPVTISYRICGTTLTRVEEFAIAQFNAGAIHPKQTIPTRSILKPVLFFGTVLVLTLSFFSTLHHFGNACLTNIEEQNYNYIFSYCVPESDLTGNNLYREDHYISVHSFGQFFDKTQEAKLIEEGAKAGDEQFQFLWWFIIQNIYKKDISPNNIQALKRLDDESEKWLQKAMAGGSVDATKVYIYRHIFSKISTNDAKEKALNLAQKLKNKGVPLSQHLLDEAKNSVTFEDIQEIFIAQRQNYTKLNIEQLENLLYALEEGFFYFKINDFLQTPRKNGNYENEIEVTKDTEKAREIRRFMEAKMESF